MNQQEMEREFTKIKNQITGELNKLDIYLPCEDGSGEIYNRKTGQRFKIEKTGNKVNNAKDPITNIGSFQKSHVKNSAAKSKIGKWS